MIRKVKFSNFYSFYNEQEISFLAKKKETYDYYNSKSEDQISKIAGFIGGNASGKTNVMRFFGFLSYFVCRKINNDFSFIPDIAYKTFFNNKKPSNFYIEFEINNNIYYYNFSIEKKIILSETLYIKQVKKGSRKLKIFSRKIKTIEELNENYFKNISKNSLPKIRDDVSFITYIKKSSFSVDIIDEVFDYFFKFKANINEVGQINNVAHQYKALNTYFENPKLKTKVENFIRYFDIGLNSFEIKKETKDDKSVISIQGIHSTKSKNNKLDFIYESRGTQSLFFTMANILNALENDAVVIIDEIESGFHPDAINKLIGYFVNENKTKRSQLIFSSHSLGFMNKLDMHQIYLVEKKQDGESLAYRLNTVKDIRSDENFLAKYMAGAYGAYPKIRI